MYFAVDCNYNAYMYMCKTVTDVMKRNFYTKFSTTYSQSIKLLYLHVHVTK